MAMITITRLRLQRRMFAVVQIEIIIQSNEINFIINVLGYSKGFRKKFKKKMKKDSRTKKINFLSNSFWPINS